MLYIIASDFLQLYPKSDSQVYISELSLNVEALPEVSHPNAEFGELEASGQLPAWQSKRSPFHPSGPCSGGVLVSSTLDTPLSVSRGPCKGLHFGT